MEGRSYDCSLPRRTCRRPIPRELLYAPRMQLSLRIKYRAPASSNLGRFQYTGQAWLPELGLYHYKARAYAPAIGRFMQPDPILWSGGMNLYAYVGNDPGNFTDPWGLVTTTSDEIRVTGARTVRSSGSALALIGAIAGRLSHLDRGGGGTFRAIRDVPVGQPSMPPTEDEVLVTAPRRPRPNLRNPPRIPLLITRLSALGVILTVLAPTDTADDDCDAPGSCGVRRQLEEECEANRNEDMQRCQVAGALYGRAQYRICEQSANFRYGECMAGGGPGAIRSPLADTPYGPSGPTRRR